MPLLRFVCARQRWHYWANQCDSTAASKSWCANQNVPMFIYVGFSVFIYWVAADHLNIWVKSCMLLLPNFLLWTGEQEMEFDTISFTYDSVQWNSDRILYSEQIAFVLESIFDWMKKYWKIIHFNLESWTGHWGPYILMVSVEKNVTFNGNENNQFSTHSSALKVPIWCNANPIQYECSINR